MYWQCNDMHSGYSIFCLFVTETHSLILKHPVSALLSVNYYLGDLIVYLISCLLRMGRPQSPHIHIPLMGIAIM